jgi:hypothetical protein
MTSKSLSWAGLNLGALRPKAVKAGADLDMMQPLQS